MERKISLKTCNPTSLIFVLSWNGTIIFNILDNTTELRMTKYIIGEIFSSSGATLYKNPSDQTVLADETSVKTSKYLRPYKLWPIKIQYIKTFFEEILQWYLLWCHFSRFLEAWQLSVCIIFFYFLHYFFFCIFNNLGQFKLT